MNFKTFLKFSKIQYYYSELRWNNCWMGTMGCCWFWLRI